jgi:serine/threonine-protein kinase
VYEPGTLVAGKYRVERLLGRGGMGVVVEATHLELRVPVALKFLGDRYANRPDIVARFLREARAAAILRSAHVCRVTDVDRLDSGLPFIVMEMLVGRDLAKLLRADGPLSTAIAADYVLQACDAVAEAHEAGIVHRDLKPGNLFLTHHRDGAPLLKVLDFGVAKVHSEDDHAITSNRAVIGSPTYMAPEQLRSARAADARSDIWSLGVVLHQLATGTTPFQGETIADLAIRAALDPLPPLHGVPAEYAQVVARCLAKAPEHRFQTAGELAAALAPIAGKPTPMLATGPQQPEIMLGPGTADPHAQTETTLRGAASAMTMRTRGVANWLWVGAAAAIAIGVGSGILLARQSPPPQPTAPAVIPMPTIVQDAAAPAIAATPPSDAAPPLDAAGSAVELVIEPHAQKRSHPAATKPPPIPPLPPPPTTHHKTKEEIGASRM